MGDKESLHLGAGARLAGDDARGTTVKSLELIRACRLGADEPIITVGEVDMHLVNALLMAGYGDLTVLHPSVDALDEVRRVLPHIEHRLILVPTDALGFHPKRRYALWHDRGLFHFLTHPEERQRYVEIVQQALRPEGHLVICAFGPDGPLQYHGVPIARYSASRLAEEFAGQFELAEHGLAVHPAPSGENHQLVHCRFQRHAPHWPVEANRD